MMPEDKIFSNKTDFDVLPKTFLNYNQIAICSALASMKNMETEFSEEDKIADNEYHSWLQWFQGWLGECAFCQMFNINFDTGLNKRSFDTMLNTISIYEVNIKTVKETTHSLTASFKSGIPKKNRIYVLMQSDIFEKDWDFREKFDIRYISLKAQREWLWKYCDWNIYYGSDGVEFSFVGWQYENEIIQDLHYHRNGNESYYNYPQGLLKSYKELKEIITKDFFRNYVDASILNGGNGKK